MKHQSIDDHVRETPEYMECRQLLARKKELQATLRDIDCALRKLQSSASASVMLAKEDRAAEGRGVKTRTGGETQKTVDDVTDTQP